MTYTKSVPMDLPTDGYFIYRDIPHDRPYDLTAPPIFFPEKDSDELFDALRAKYPLVKSHSERMRDAMIEFLLEERDAALATESPTFATETTTISPSWPNSQPSFSSESSTWSSPDTFDLTTPTFGNSPQPHVPHRSVATSTTLSNELNAHALENMTSVFSLSSTTQPKQRVRRKMTEAEKAEYRKRRIAKACEPCARRKRKCQHNQPEIDVLQPKMMHKISKMRPPQKLAANEPWIEQFDFDNLPFDDQLVNDMQLFDDFTHVLGDEMAEYHSDLHDRPWDQLLWLNDNATSPYHVQTQWPGSVSAKIHDHQSGLAMQLGIDDGILQTNTTAVSHDEGGQLSWDGLQQQSSNPNQLVRTEPHLQYTTSRVNSQGHGHGNPPSGGNGPLWEPIFGPAQPTHTAHVHDSEGGDSYVFNGPGQVAAHTASRGSSGLPTPLAPLTLQRASAPNATRSSSDLLAVRAFGAVADLQTSASGRSPGAAMRFGRVTLESRLPSLPATSTSALHSTLDKSSHPHLRTGENAKMDGIPSNLAPVSSERPPLGTNGTPRQEEAVPLARSIGDGIMRAPSPSLELYRLKRRIPKAMHSIVDRNNASLTATPFTRLTASTSSWSSLPDKNGEPSLQVQQPHAVTARFGYSTDYAGADSVHANSSRSYNAKTTDALIATPGIVMQTHQAAAPGRQQVHLALQGLPQPQPVSTLPPPQQDKVYVAKKRDTKRYRDHNGELAWRTTTLALGDLVLVAVLALTLASLLLLDGLGLGSGLACESLCFGLGAAAFLPRRSGGVGKGQGGVRVLKLLF